MHTGYYFGIFLAAIANYTIGVHFGWRAMFVLGGTPALLVSLIRYGVKEPEKWKRKATALRGSFFTPLKALFTADLRGRTLLNCLYLLISMTGLWAGSVYVPSSVTALATKAGYDAATSARFASWGTMILSAGTIAGCLLVAPLAERIGRRATLAIFFALMFVSVAYGFGSIFYWKENALPWFFATLALLGVGGANFAVYTLWLPEQYPTECRASAFAFATSIGRFVAAGVTFLVGAAVAQYQTIGTPVAWTSVAFLIGLLLLPLGFETKGQELPA
jgi:MFS family permease